MNNSYVFDIDGVLCIYRYCDKKVSLNEADWIMECMRGTDTYKTAKPVKKFVKFIKDMAVEDFRNVNDFYVCSAASGSPEGKVKENWIKDNYPHIKPDNIIIVGSSSYKLAVLKAIYEKTGKPVVLIDDKDATVIDVDTDKNENLISLHISEFLDESVMDTLIRLGLE